MAGTDCCHCNYSRLAVGAVAGSNLLAAAAAAAQEAVVALVEIKCVSKVCATVRMYPNARLSFECDATCMATGSTTRSTHGSRRIVAVVVAAVAASSSCAPSAISGLAGRETVLH